MGSCGSREEADHLERKAFLGAGSEEVIGVYTEARECLDEERPMPLAEGTACTVLWQGGLGRFRN